ncbi:MAG: NUDIX hydrolase [Candidatus Aenigmatarchaeota archaeon]
MSGKKVGAGIGVILLKDGKILLGRRTDDRSKGTSELKGEGTWTLPGGKLHFHESFEKAAAREIEEETGIKANSLEVISVTNDMVPEKHFVTIGLICTDFEGDAKVMEPEEITEWGWFDLNSLPSPMFFPSEKLIKNFLAKRFYKH